MVNGYKSLATSAKCSCLARSLRVAAHDLDLVRLYRRPVLQLEVDILDLERPHFVAEPIDVEVALKRTIANQHIGCASAQ